MSFTNANNEVLKSTRLRRRLLLLAPLLGLLLSATLWQLNTSYDLAYFLPTPHSDAEQILVERLGQGPGAELVFVPLGAADQEQLAEVVAKLRRHELFTQVWPDAEHDLALPSQVQSNRLLLGDLPQTVAGWHAVLAQRTADMSSAPDERLLELIAEDPALLSIEAIASLGQPLDPATLSNEDSTILVLRSAVPAFDMLGQQRVHDTLQTVMADSGLAAPQLYGTGQYGLALQQSVRRESMLFTTLAGLALCGLVLWRFGSVTGLLCSALPLVVGALAGLLVLALSVEAVHGITLAFGFTLLGVAVDYPLHTLTHHQLQPRANTRTLWRTLRLGVVSTVIAYLAFMLSGTSGLLQLGLFASVGISTAALCTGFLMRGFGTNTLRPNKPADAIATSIQLSHAPWLIVLAVLLPGLASLHLFNDDLGALTPVPKETLAADNALRQRLGTVDLRYLVALRAASEEQALQATEALAPSLQQAISNEMLGGYQAITGLLPSQQQQRKRRAALTNMQASEHFATAVSASAFRTDAFAPFLAAVAVESTRREWLTAQSYADQPALQELLTSHLYQQGDEWVSLVYLRAVEDPKQLAAVLESTSAATLVDLKQASVTLVSDYRQRLLRVLGVALVGITLLLWLRTGQARRALWLMGTLLGAIGLAMFGRWLLGGPLSLFDLMALTLVAGLGLDYALFYSQPEDNPEQRQVTHQAVTICAASSLLVFGILSRSSIPLLEGIGTTVAIGVIAAYGLAYCGRYEKPAS